MQRGDGMQSWVVSHVGEPRGCKQVQTSLQIPSVNDVYDTKKGHNDRDMLQMASLVERMVIYILQSSYKI